MKALLTIILLFYVSISYAQDSLSEENYAIEPDRIAKEAVSKIVQYTGLTPNFIVVADNNVSTAIAYLKNNNRIIAYNPKFIEILSDKTSTNWAAVSVLAHEIGHHLSGHTLPKNSSPGNELIADKFSGFILFQMGATINEAKTALSTIGHEMDTTKHPPKLARLAAIEEGWIEAKNLRNVNAYNKLENTSKECLTQFEYQCYFFGDDNVYLIDEKDHVIWYDNYGKPIIIGSKEKSTNTRYEWIYNYLDNYYGVDAKGNMWKETTYGSFFKVGEIQKINK